MERIYNRIKELREAHQMTVEELARETGITIERINKIEESSAKQVDIQEGAAIARVLECRLGALFDDRKDRTMR